MSIIKKAHHRVLALLVLALLDNSFLTMASGTDISLRGANTHTDRAKRILQIGTKGKKGRSNAGAPHQSGARDESPPDQIGEDSLPPPQKSQRPLPTENVEKFTYSVDQAVPLCVRRSYTVFKNHIAVKTYKQDESSGAECLEENRKFRESRISTKQYEKMLQQLRQYIKDCDPDPDCTPCAGAESFRLGLYQDALVAGNPSFTASLDACQQQCGTGGACGDPEAVERIIVAREKVARKRMRRMQFSRKKAKRVGGITFAVAEGSFPCANTINYYVEARSIVMTKTNIGFESGGCDKIDEEMTVSIKQKEFRQLRNLLSKYKIRRCKPNFEAELNGGTADAVGGENYSLVLLSSNAADMFDSSGSDLCGDTASLASRLAEYF